MPLFPRRTSEVVQGLAREFARRKNLTGIPDEYALFETFSAYCVTSQEHLDFEPDDLRKGEPNDRGIDAYAIVINRKVYTLAEEVRDRVRREAALDVHFILIQAKRERKFRGDVFDDLASAILDIFGDKPLVEPCSDNVKNLRECARAIYGDLDKFRQIGTPRLSVWYSSLGTFNRKAHQTKIATTRARLTGSRRFRSVHVEGAGSHQLRDMYRSAESMSSASITMLSQAELPKIDGVRKAIFGVVRAVDLVENVLLTKGGGRRPYLFEYNMRDHLSGTRVNEAIAHTLTSPALREQFAVMNNGVTIVTSEIVDGGVDDAKGKLNLTDPLIVNGCQTCNVLLANRTALDASVMVAVRVIEATSPEIVERIVTATNTQNDLPIKSGVLSNAHRTLELYFSTRPQERRLYYERRLGQHGREEHFDRVVTRQQLTQAYASMWLGEAHRASRHTMLEDTYRDHMYRESEDPLRYYTAAAVFNRILWLFGKGVPRAYWMARFHLVAGVRAYVEPDASDPRTELDVEKKCGPILDAIWGPTVKDIALEILGAVRIALGPGGDIRELGQYVRTEPFGEAFLRAVRDLPR